MAGMGYSAAVILGIVAFVMFALAVAVNFGYLSSFAGTTPSSLSVYGILAAAGAVGGYEWDRRL